MLWPCELCQQLVPSANHPVILGWEACKSVGFRVSGLSPWGHLSRLETREKITGGGSVRLLVGSFEWQFRDSRRVCRGALCGELCGKCWHALTLFFSVRSPAQLYLSPSATCAFSHTSPFSPTTLPLLLLPVWRLSLLIFSTLFFFSSPSPCSPFPFCLVLHFPAESSWSKATLET